MSAHRAASQDVGFERHAVAVQAARGAERVPAEWPHEVTERQRRGTNARARRLLDVAHGVVSLHDAVTARESGVEHAKECGVDDRIGVDHDHDIVRGSTVVETGPQPRQGRSFASRLWVDVLVNLDADGPHDLDGAVGAMVGDDVDLEQDGGVVDLEQAPHRGSD